MLVAVERVAGKDRNRGKHFTTFMTNITSNKKVMAVEKFSLELEHLCIVHYCELF